MHATPTAPDLTLSLGGGIDTQQAQRDALQIFHRMMHRLADDLTGASPSTEEPAQARNTTQRIRLCIQAARDILRHCAPAKRRDDSPTRPWRQPGLPSPTRPWRQPGRTPPNTQSASPNADAPNTANTQNAQSSAQALSRETAQHATTLLAAAGAGVSRFGERINSPLPPEASPAALTPDSALIVHGSPAPRDSSLVAHTSPLPAPIPPRPQYFTDEEFKQIIATLRTKDDRLTPRLYARILEWNAYAIPAGLSPSLGIKSEVLESRKPLEECTPAGGTAFPTGAASAAHRSAPPQPAEPG